MMSVTVTATNAQETRRVAQQTADDVLDTLDVTDRVYHHLEHTKQLVVELAQCVLAAHPAPARVLLVGTDSLLPTVLLRLGYQIELWHFPQGYLIDDLRPYVRATVSPERLAGGDIPVDGGPYDAIVVPLVLESLPGSPVALLARLRTALAPLGSLVLATTNASRLDLRLLAIAGRSTAAAYPSSYLSFSFPPLPRRHYYHPDDLLALMRDAGLQVERWSYIMAHEACFPVDPYPPHQYAWLQLRHQLTRMTPGAQHAVLFHAHPRVGDSATPTATAGRHPRVSAVLSVSGGGNALRQALGALIHQDYPEGLLDVIVLHDGRSAETEAAIAEIAAEARVPVRQLVMLPPEGPAARNAAMRVAAGDICAHTDDACQIPLGWIRTLAEAMDGTTAAVTGPVVEAEGSHPDYFVLPGSRAGWEYHGLYPISNVAYRRLPALAAGGFAGASPEAERAQLGWDTELAWRLERQGWKKRFVRDQFLYRTYQPPGRLAWVRAEWRLAQELPASVTRAPGLGKQLLTAGRFAARRTLFFDLLVLGLAGAVASRRPRWLVLGLPWLGYVSKYVDVWPVTQWPSSGRRFAALSGRHLVWLAGLVYGSIKARRTVL